MSLANVLAAAASASSLVLLGDPQQRPAAQGSHPPGADRSALAHLLGERVTIADDRASSWNEHGARDLCAYTSESSTSRLESQPNPRRSALRGQGRRGEPAHAWWKSTTGATASRRGRCGRPRRGPWSRAVRPGLIRMALSSPSVGGDRDRGGLQRPGWRDQDAPSRRSRVGTVDKFQGQEAPISIYSMASSSADDAPQGMTFLYSRHRLNVAIARPVRGGGGGVPQAAPRQGTVAGRDATGERARALRRDGRVELLRRAARQAGHRRLRGVEQVAAELVVTPAQPSLVGDR